MEHGDGARFRRVFLNRRSTNGVDDGTGTNAAAREHNDFTKHQPRQTHQVVKYQIMNNCHDASAQTAGVLFCVSKSLYARFCCSILTLSFSNMFICHVVGW